MDMSLKKIILKFYETSSKQLSLPYIRKQEAKNVHHNNGTK